MKKKNLKKMSLNKENISQLSLSELKGGILSDHRTIGGPSECYCRSNEHNCNSQGHRCDCGTTGNCGDLV